MPASSPACSVTLASLRRLANGAAPVGIRGCMMLLSLLVVPIVAPFLGKDDLGRYAVLQSVTAWLGLASLGLVEACSGLLSKYNPVDNNGNGQRYLVTAFWIVTRVSTVLLVLASVGSVTVMLTTGIGLGTLAPWLVCATFALASAPFLLAQAPLNVRGDITRATTWGFATSVAGVGAVLVVTQIAVKQEYRLLAVVTAAGLTSFVVRVVMYRIESRRFCVGRTGGSALTWRRVQPLLQSGYPFIVISAAALAAFQVDRFIAYSLLSPEETARLDITLKVFLAVHALYMVLVAKLWHSVGQPWNAGNRTRTRHAFLKALKTGLAFWIAAGALLVPSINPIVRTFTGGMLSVSDWSFVIAVACYIGARGVIDTVSVSIFAIRQQRATLATVILHGIINIPLSVIGCHLLGLTGIVIGQTVSLLITSGWRFPVIFWKATAAAT